MPDKKRIDWIDISKGIGIICVVIPHFLGFYGLESSNYKTIYITHLFHMPLFFFISGYLYKKESYSVNFTKKFCQLMIPYIAIFALLLPILYSAGVIDDISMKSVLKYFLWGGRNLKWLFADAFIPMWFLTCLFLTSIIYNALNNMLGSTTMHIAMGISLLLAYVNSVFFPLFSLPWNLQVVPFTIVIYHIGHLVRIHHFKIGLTTNILLTIAVLTFVLLVEGNYIAMALNEYGIPIVTLICSLVMIMMINNISKLLLKVKSIKDFLSWFGKISLTIMAFHYAIYFIVSKYFEMDLFIAVLVVLAISSLLYWVFNKFKISKILFLGKGYDDISNMLNKLQKNAK